MAALSEQLVHVHQALRERLTSLRQEAAGGTGHRAADTAIGEDLLSHCLSFCTAIHAHHAGEDSQLLPALRAAAPELAPVIDNLTEDHAVVAGILRQVRELLTPGRADSGPAGLVRELDGLIAILELLVRCLGRASGRLRRWSAPGCRARSVTSSTRLPLRKCPALDGRPIGREPRSTGKASCSFIAANP